VLGDPLLTTWSRPSSSTNIDVVLVVITSVGPHCGRPEAYPRSGSPWGGFSVSGNDSSR
jgi:hypothetical protein